MPTLTPATLPEFFALGMGEVPHCQWCLGLHSFVLFLVPPFLMLLSAAAARIESLCSADEDGWKALPPKALQLEGFLPPNMFYHLMLEFFVRFGGKGAAERREQQWEVHIFDRAGAFSSFFSLRSLFPVQADLFCFRSLGVGQGG